MTACNQCSQASSAHRTFFDAKNGRQVLWGSVGGAPCPGSNWAGLMSFPRVVALDPEDGARLVTFPLPEISRLWTNTSRAASPIQVAPGATHRPVLTTPVTEPIFKLCAGNDCQPQRK